MSLVDLAGSENVTMSGVMMMMMMMMMMI